MPGRKRTLMLHEEIMLLALRDEKGTPVSSWYSHAMGGGILAALLLAGRVAIDPDRRKLVNIVDDTPLGEPVADECLDRIATARRRASAQTWVSRFAQMRKLKDRVALGLCERGVLRADEGTVLLIFRRKVYPELDPRPEQALIERLRRAIFEEVEVDARTALLISLADAADLLNVPFSKRELRGRRKRIKQIANGDVVCGATRDAVQAAQTAVMVACITPAITAATVSS